MTAITLEDLFSNLFASAIPNADEIDVELWAAPNGSYSLSDLFVKPDKPSPCRNAVSYTHLTLPTTNSV